MWSRRRTFLFIEMCTVNGREGCLIAPWNDVKFVNWLRVVNNINPKDNRGTQKYIITGNREETREQEKWFESQA